MRPKSESLSVLLLFVFFSLSSYAQPQGIRFDNKSSWIKDITYDPKATSETGKTAGYYYLLLDEQENTITQEDYYHYAYVVLTSEGIQEIADLNFSFDPAFQSLHLHEISLIRGGNKINHLTKDIQVFSRNKTWSATCMMDHGLLLSI